MEKRKELPAAKPTVRIAKYNEPQEEIKHPEYFKQKKGTSFHPNWQVSLKLFSFNGKVVANKNQLFSY